jgi:uncharacterized membrane protein
MLTLDSILLREGPVLSVYGGLMFLHVLSVVVWVGGVSGLTVVIWRVARERNREALAVIVRHATFFGQRLAGPASAIVLLSGLPMVGLAHIGFRTFWVLWGFTGLVLHFLLGALVLRKRTLEVVRLASTRGDDAELLTASRRWWRAQLLYLAVLASVVAAMVLKPTF